MPFRRAHLRYFVAVAEERQITRAALKLNVAQPALSRAIADLEAQLGVQLFERQARGVTLTPAGATLYWKARKAVDAALEATHTAQALARGAGSELVFGFFGAPPALHSPDLLSGFSTVHPDVEIRFHELKFPGPVTSEWLEEVDLVLSHIPPEDPAVWVQLLRLDPRVVIAHRDHPIAASTGLTVADLVDETFVGFDASVDAGWAGFWSLDDHLGARPTRLTPAGASNPQEILAAVAQGRAISTMPRCHAESILSGSGAMLLIPILDAAPCRLALAGRNDRRNGRVGDLVDRARTESASGERDLFVASSPGRTINAHASGALS
jgi:DNA-binding transcriptional LysR family regulator